ncbi:MAG: hypothetical protein JEY94_16175 [Melioribacteraceae bacterium]|nr:hypothetical protein [Melioribacteraceae bacterium]
MKTALFFLFIFISIINAQDKDQIIHSLDGAIIYDVCGDKDNLWAASYGNGVYQYSKKKNKWINYSTKNNALPHDFFYCITSNEKYVWAGSSDGLFIFDKRTKRWKKRKFGKGGQLSNWIRSIAYDKHLDAVWIGRFKYLTKLDIKKRRFTDYDLTVEGDDKTNTIKSIKIDADSLVWFGTEAGLHKYKKARRFHDKGAVTFYDNSRSYFNGEGETVSISTLLFEQGNIWIGLDEFVTRQKTDYNVGGLYRFDRGNEWLRFDMDDGFYGNGIADLELIGNQIWAALYQFHPDTKEQFGRGIALIDRKTFEVTMIPESEMPSAVFSIYFDKKYVWLGTSKGIFKIDLTNKLANLK